ncbi:hypothetical protein C8Q77DRAFT_835320 [Trametes polyzona]|nr:hypothetical protein C8Q77DRAFT_835320 [Trametes polyzona]
MWPVVMPQWQLRDIGQPEQAMVLNIVYCGGDTIELYVGLATHSQSFAARTFGHIWNVLVVPVSPSPLLSPKTHTAPLNTMSSKNTSAFDLEVISFYIYCIVCFRVCTTLTAHLLLDISSACARRERGGASRTGSFSVHLAVAGNEDAGRRGSLSTLECVDSYGGPAYSGFDDEDDHWALHHDPSSAVNCAREEEPRAGLRCELGPPYEMRGVERVDIDVRVVL